MPQQSIVSGVQHQLRRGTYSQIAVFTGAVGEVLYDLTYNRPSLQDGATPGGFAQAMLTSTFIAGTGNTVNLNANVGNVFVDTNGGIATLALPPAAQFMPGQVLSIVDVGGASGTHNITITANTTSEQIYSTAGVASTSTLLNVNFKELQLISNSSAKWVGVALL